MGLAVATMSILGEIVATGGDTVVKVVDTESVHADCPLGLSSTIG